MRFEWDESKNALNIKKHKIDLADVPSIFNGPIVVDYDDSKDYGEDRWIGIGLLRNTVIVVVFTERGRDTVRIISARKANRYEREKYAQALKD
jgi:uncharacterized DUF497 family protein